MTVRSALLRSGAALGAIATVSAVAIAPGPLHACAVATPPGVQVSLAEESAVIVWDPATKTEHFIRRASFDASAKEWGFLVPTPGVPGMAEADDAAFTPLEEMIQPPVKENRRTGIYLTSIFASTATDHDATSKSGVAVVHEQRVGDYEAVVLKADDPKDLASWLRTRGYSNDPALRAWLAPYVAKRWHVTAFKMAAPADAASGPARLRSSAMRMTFQTDAPVFPYREPRIDEKARTRTRDRSLRLFVFAPQRMEAHLGAQAATGWPGKTVWANALPHLDRKSLGPLLGMRPEDLSASSWLTVLEDESSVRPGADDLYFSPAKIQASRTPSAVETDVDARVGMPVEILLFFVAGVAWIVRRIRAGTPMDRPGV